MSEVTNNTSNQQVYSVHGGDSLLNQVVRVICILMPRGLVVAGFSDRGDLLMVRYSDYKKDLPTWILDFFEHQFINEPLLATPQKVSAVFVASDKSFIVPEVLYDETAADKWMQQLYYLETTDITSIYHLQEDKANYIYAWPSPIQILITRYFAKAKILPFSTYQFYKPYQAPCYLLCSITADQVYATLYNNNTLTWHQVFGYETAEDIAYHIKLLCEQQGINTDEMMFQCTMTNKGLAFIVNQLAQYFPGMKDGSGNVSTNDKNWTGTIYLLQQLYACAL